MTSVLRQFNDFCRERDIAIHLSHEMPAGYETAYGTYDVTRNTLYLHPDLLKRAPAWQRLFYLFHELRHAEQYLHPERFDQPIRDSLPYVILYSGVCFKLADGSWLQCSLEGDEAFFTDAYLGLPYELDANRFAFEQTKAICGDLPELQQLYVSWLPKRSWPWAEHCRLFDRIDSALAAPKR